MAPGRCRGARP